MRRTRTHSTHTHRKYKCLLKPRSAGWDMQDLPEVKSLVRDVEDAGRDLESDHASWQCYSILSITTNDLDVCHCLSTRWRFDVSQSLVLEVCLHMFACCLSARHQNVWRQLVSPDKDISAFQLMVMANLLDDKVLQSELEDSHSAAATPVCWPPVLRPCDWCQIIIHNLPFSAYQSD